MTVAFVALVAVIALAWVLAAARSGGVMMESTPERDALAERKVAALSALADLDDELSAGKVTPEDHAALRSTYEAAAIDVLHDIDDAAER